MPTRAAFVSAAALIAVCAAASDVRVGRVHRIASADLASTTELTSFQVRPRVLAVWALRGGQPPACSSQIRRTSHPARRAARLRRRDFHRLALRGRLRLYRAP